MIDTFKQCRNFLLLERKLGPFIDQRVKLEFIFQQHVVCSVKFVTQFFWISLTNFAGDL